MLVIDMHLALINAAYPNLLSFVSQTSTGFMNTAPGAFATAERSRTSGNREGSIGRLALRSNKDSRNRTTATARVHGAEGDGISLDSFGSRAIIIHQSVTVDNTSRHSRRTSEEDEHP